jgi:hypothetical protein
VARFERCIRLLSRSLAQRTASVSSLFSPLVDLSCIRLTVYRFSQEISRGTPPTMFCTRFAGFSLLSATVSELTLRLFSALLSARTGFLRLWQRCRRQSVLNSCRVGRGLNSHLVYRHEGPRDWPLQGLWLCRVLLPYRRSLYPLIFQTYGSSQEAEAAINAMNEQELDGRRVRVCARSTIQRGL